MALKSTPSPFKQIVPDLCRVSLNRKTTAASIHLDLSVHGETCSSAFPSRKHIWIFLRALRDMGRNGWAGAREKKTDKFVAEARLFKDGDVHVMSSVA